MDDHPAKATLDPFLAVAIVVLSTGCATTIVRPTDVGPTASPPRTWNAPGVMLVSGPTPEAMAAEVRAFATNLDVHEVHLPADSDLTSVCPAPGYMVLRPALTRTYFASNAGDRNALMIYEAAVVVGLPVTLISAVAWSWYGETTTEGTLDALRCGEPSTVWHLVASTRIRSEGRGFVRGGTIRDAQAEAAVRAVTRKLLAMHAEEVRKQEGGSR